MGSLHRINVEQARRWSWQGRDLDGKAIPVTDIRRGCSAGGGSRELGCCRILPIVCGLLCLAPHQTPMSLLRHYQRDLQSAW